MPLRRLPRGERRRGHAEQPSSTRSVCGRVVLGALLTSVALLSSGRYLALPAAAQEATPYTDAGEIVASPTSTATVEVPTATVVPTATPTPVPGELSPTAAASVTPVEAGSATATAVMGASPTAEPSSTPTVSPTPSVTTTPVPTPTLPPLSDVTDSVGMTNQTVIGITGGRIASPDGRVVIDFPPGAVSEDLAVSIHRQETSHPRPAHPDARFVARWQFEAEAVAGAAVVHRFDEPLQFNFRFRPGDLPPAFDPATLAFWTLDEASQAWVALPSAVGSEELHLVGQADHFSEDAITANSLVSMAPLLDGENVGMQGLSAELPIPIEVPPGRGGLAPQLAFTYSSNRLFGMRGYADHASWAGLGWELDTPNIQVDWWSANPSDPPRAFVSVNGVGGEMMREGTDAGQHVWRLRDENYWKIRSTCTDFDCEVHVWDQSGTKYVFGDTATTDYERWYRDASDNRKMYRLDLRFIEDALGNKIDFEYWQQKHDAPQPYGHDEVMAAYPKRISYNGGAAEVLFNGGDPANNGWEVAYQNPYASDETILQRWDTPHDGEDSDCDVEDDYVAPRIRETRKLVSVDVKVSGNLVRRYLPSFRQPSSFDIECWQERAAAGSPDMHEALQLDALTMTDRNGTGYIFTTTSFAYLGGQMQYFSDTAAVFEYMRPLLDRATNGFGGAVDFDYAWTGENPGTYHWERPVVSAETKIPGANQPNITTTYARVPGNPQYWKNVNPYQPAVSEDFSAEFRGFTGVTETDAEGNQVIHAYKPSATWADQPLAGREYDVEVKDAGGTSWNRATTTYKVRSVANWTSSTGFLVNFVAPETTTTTLRGGAQFRQTTEYDEGASSCSITACQGLVSKVTDEGSLSGTGDDVITRTGFHRNTTDWIFVPRYSEQLEPAPSNAVLSCSRLYYDGGDSIADTPGNGLITATSLTTAAAGAITSAQCEGASAISPSTNAYLVYDAYGNLVQASVATATPPEVAAGSGASGWIPPSLSYALTVYDDPADLAHLFPSRIINPEGHETTYEYDYVLGKPTTVTAPNGRSTETRYDALGRVTHAWDNLDSETYPSAKFIYNWGAVPNRTLTETRTVHGTAQVTRSAVCMDGFGREFERRAYYQASLVNSARTDYDAVGRKVVETAPVFHGLSFSCPAGGAPTSARNRTAYQYDPLGNVVRTTFLAANASSGPSTAASHGGLVAAVTDERGNTTTQISNPAARTLTVTEPSTSVGVIKLRPSSQGSYEQWDFENPAAAHYLNVDDINADNEASQYNDQQWNRKDTQRFPAAGLAADAVVESVTFKFRWKHFDNVTPNPSGPNMWALFRQGGQDVRGPTFRSTNAEGWVEGSWTMEVNPRTGQPWSAAELNGAGGPLELGFEIYPTLGAWNYLTQTWAEVRHHAPAASVTTTYAYDRLGQLTGVTDAMGNVTTIEYDLAGRKTEMTDPDMGHWSYGYNSAGSLTSQTDARSVETHIEYDNLERPEHKYYVNATDPPVEWLYDVYPTDTGNLACTSPGGFQTAQGMMTGMIDGAGTAFACYDERGRQTDTRRLITGDATAYDISSTYDALGQVDELTYPDGEVVRIDKYNEGQASGLTSTSYGETLASAAWYTPWGAPSQVVLGNGLTTAYGYDSRGRLTSLTTAAVQNLAQTYDEASNVKTVTDATAGETVTYTYDKLNRLTAATGFLGGFTALYAYDKVGNLTRKAEGQLDLTLAYPAAGQPRPHAVTSAKFTGTATDYKTLAYDLNGNLDHVNSAAESDYTFDAENRLSARTYGGATTAYTYDGGGTMLKRSTVGAGGTETTTYIGGIYEKTLRPGGVTETTKYYQFGGRTVAMRTLPPGGGVPEDKEDCANGADDDADNLLDDGCVLYLLADHLGGTTAILDEAGNKVVSRKYWPYGGDRTMVGDQRLTDLWYTGQREEDFDGLGLYNYKARFYSTTLGRFVSADPIGFESEERYAFASYNPLKFIDPNGLDAVVACGNGQQCESGADVGQYQSFITQYWANNGYGFGGFTYDEVFGLLTWVMTNFKWEPSRMLDAFGVAFLDTSANLRSGAVNRSLNKYMDKLDGILAHDYWHDTNGRAVDTLIGFSEGGATIAKALYRNQERFKVYNYYASIRGVVFLDPAFNVPFLGNFFDVPAVDQNDFPGIKFVTVNGVGSRVWGVVANSEYNFTSFECVSAAFSHCSHGEHGSLIMNILQGYCFPVSYPTYDVLIPGAACARGYR